MDNKVTHTLARTFQELGVPLHEEKDGKLFPDTNRARTVLENSGRIAQVYVEENKERITR